MPIAPGDRLGPYEVVAQIGEGGMGVVYRARDSRVGRDVAIKFSSEHFSDRFEREARASAALNHPNVCTLHDVGPDYLVMELVEGPTLAEFLAARRTALPLDEALPIARQIADALDAAHQRGIIHRDLKPANIKVRDDGTVKVLDFGLAKTEQGSGIGGQRFDEAEPSQLPTRAGATGAGVILGTAAYMAPEQARGKPVDKRADIWAFGVVFYEMITGRRLFDGDDASTIMAKVLESQPRWDDVPARARRLLQQCLEKDPRNRLRDIGDVWKLLDDEQPVAGRSSRARNAGWIAAAAMAVVAIVAWWSPWRRAAPEAAQPFVRLDVNLGADVSMRGLGGPTFSTLIISPDEARVVFAGSVSGGTPRLFSRRLDESNVVEIAGTEGAQNPFFSPNGKWIAFWTGEKLFKVPVEGGAPIPLAELNVMVGGSWVDEDSLVVGLGDPYAEGLVRVSADGGMPTPLSKLAPGELYHTFPQVLPRRNAVLISVVHAPPDIETNTVEILLLDSGERKVIVRGAVAARYLASGHIVYTNRAGFFALPFDLDALAPRGAAVPILSDVATDTVTFGGQFDVSRLGTLVYRSAPGGSDAPLTSVQWIAGDGTRVPLLEKLARYAGDPRVSPDGGRVALTIRDGANHDIWVYDAQRAAMTRLTSGGTTFASPVWSHDGRYVIFGSLGRSTFWTRADGSGQPRQLLSTGTFQFPDAVTPDGQRMIFQQIENRPQLWTVDLRQDESGITPGTPVPFLKTPFTDQDARISPDGRWVAYASNESGKFEVYVRPFSATALGTQGRVQISNSGGGVPRWSPKGGELLYIVGDQIMAVSYTTSGETFIAARPREWASGVRGALGMDFAPAGDRVLINLPNNRDTQAQQRTVVFLQNFFDELRRRAPASP